MFEVALVLLIHARNQEEVRQVLETCIQSDLRIERKEVQYCEENLSQIITLQ